MQFVFQMQMQAAVPADAQGLQVLGAMFAAGSRGKLVDSAGESDSTSSSPLSTDSGNGAENAAASFRTGACVEQSEAPAQALGELAIVEDSRRSRRSRNGRWRTPTSETAKETQRVNKNARERVRVRSVNKEYESLRLSMGAPPLPNDRGRRKKVKKVATLNHAIGYIEALTKEFEQLRSQAREPPLEHLGPSGSRASSAGAEVEPKVNEYRYAIQHAFCMMCLQPCYIVSPAPCM